MFVSLADRRMKLGIINLPDWLPSSFTRSRKTALLQNFYGKERKKPPRSKSGFPKLALLLRWVEEGKGEATHIRFGNVPGMGREKNTKKRRNLQLHRVPPIYSVLSRKYISYPLPAGRKSIGTAYISVLYNYPTMVTHSTRRRASFRGLWFQRITCQD